MNQKTQPQIIELDLIGQYYASIINEKQSGVFSISAHLKESVNPQILQQAVNDLMRRLPFVSGRLRRGFFHYAHEVIAEPPLIKPVSEPYAFSDYYNKGSGHVLRIVYGERHFTVETIHSICDGRGLTKITSALLVRYFELLGVTMDKSGVIDCSDSFQPEEAENAFLRYANSPNKKKTEKKKPPSKSKAYQPIRSKSTEVQVITRKFSANEIKSSAKEHGATVSEYILAHIFRAVAEERAARGIRNPITAMIPIDCRSFFPSKTLRSFVSAATVVMPETDDFSEMLRQIRAQFETINKESVLGEISELQNLYNKFRFAPRIAKKLFMKMFESANAAASTTGLSNLGLVKLPAEITGRVDSLDFAISLEESTPYFFSCVTVGDALALTATFREDYRGLVGNVMDLLLGERKR